MQHHLNSSNNNQYQENDTQYFIYWATDGPRAVRFQAKIKLLCQAVLQFTHNLRQAVADAKRGIFGGGKIARTKYPL